MGGILRWSPLGSDSIISMESLGMGLFLKGVCLLVLPHEDSGTVSHLCTRQQSSPGIESANTLILPPEL
jgi:hypothetical protein